MDRVRLWAALTALTGIATLAITLAFTQLQEVKAAGACQAADGVIQFELARTQAELTAIFKPAADPCRPKVIAAMDAVNHLDVLAYIPSYTAFGVFAALFLSGGAARRPLVLATIGVALTALAADYVETITLLQITPQVDAAAELLGRSSAAAWTKFGMLALSGLMLAGICWTTASRRRILGALLVLPSLGFALMAYDHHAYTRLLNLAFFASWTPLLLMALRRAATGRG